MSRLLFMDDDPIELLEQMRRFLIPSRIDITVARTGAEGLQLAEKDPFDIVLLNISMRDMPGLEVYKRLRQIDPRLPVVLLTDKASAETALEAVREGAYDYLFKPVDVAQLERVIMDVLQLSRRMREPSATDGFRFESYIKDRLAAGTSDLYTETHLQLDRILLPATLRWVNGNQLHAARILGIARQTLRNRLRELGLTITKSVDGDGAAQKHDDGVLRRIQQDGQSSGDGDGSPDDRRSMNSYR